MLAVAVAVPINPKDSNKSRKKNFTQIVYSDLSICTIPELILIIY